VRYNLVASHLTGARRGPDSITAECAKKMNTTFEIEEVSSDFFSALENAELCHGVKRNLALEISRDEPKIGKIGTPKPVIPPFMPLVKRDVAPDEPKIGDPRGDQENLCVPQEGKTTARKRRLPASLSPAANEIQNEGCHDLPPNPQSSLIFASLGRWCSARPLRRSIRRSRGFDDWRRFRRLLARSGGTSSGSSLSRREQSQG